MKRLSDVVLALLLGIVSSPVMVATAAMVFFSLGRPLIFVQRRAGRRGEEFALLKWRSMNDAAGSDGQPLSDEERVTPVGLLIRRLRIDELPSVLNILRGDLSFVGPRPLPASADINQQLNGARLAVRPGLTGLAQVSGNTLLSNEEKLAIDLYYIRNHGLAGDLLIIWQTLVTVLAGERRNEELIDCANRQMEMST